MKETAAWGRQRGQPERKREREDSRYSLDDLCGSDAISEASLESGLSPGTPVLVNHRDPPTPVPFPPRASLSSDPGDAI